ncbi:MAG: DUF4926 domain-containing protein [Symbiopectobacterium sp.]
MVMHSFFDIISLSVDFPAHGLKKGMIGTIIHIYTNPNLAYEI